MNKTGLSSATIQEQYNDLKPKVLAAMIWLDDPKNKLLVDKWYPHYKQRFDELTKLERSDAS